MSTPPTFGRSAEVEISQSDQRLGGRLPLLDPSQSAPAARELYERLAPMLPPWPDSDGFQTKTSDGRLIGPFNPMLCSPGVSAGFVDFIEAEARSTSLDNRVRQAVTLAVGAAWNAPYELYPHSAEAPKPGLPAEVTEAQLAGGIPAQPPDTAK